MATPAPAHPARVAFLTGAPWSGKSTLAHRLLEDHHIPVLHCDGEVFARVFQILNCPQFTQSICPQESWRHLRQQYDFDRLFRLHHRDWYAVHGMPRSFVAEGQIYCFKEWREQVQKALRKLPRRVFRYRLFVLSPPLDVAFERYKAAQAARGEEGAGFLAKPAERQRMVSDGHFRHFRQRDLEVPPTSEMVCEQVADDAELISRIVAFCGA